MNAAGAVSFGYAHLLRRLSGPTYVSGDGEAVVFREQRLTYRQLHDRAARLADALAGDGVGKGDRVAVLLRNDPVWFDVFFAVAALGAVLVPVNFLLRSGEVAFILKDSQAGTLIVGDDLAETARAALADAPACTRRFVVANAGGVRGPGAGALTGARELTDFAASSVAAFPDVAVSLSDPNLLQYTSGTTGFPKGATHTVSTLLWNSFHQIGDFDVRPTERYLCVPALCWAAGLHDVTLATLWVGATVVLQPSGGLTIADLLAVLERERITQVLLVPTILKQLVEAPNVERCDLSALRCVLTGAEPVPVPVIVKFQALLPGVTLIQGYGMSEGPTIATALRPEDAVRKVGSCGKPTTNTELRVVDDEDRDVPAGTVGEILTRSPATMVGYWNQPEATAATLRGGWLHTGDLGVLDAEGFLTICGRKKDMYISGGLNVYPAEAEAVLLADPSVAEAAVFGVADARWGEVGWAVVVPRPGQQPDAEALLAACRAALATYKVPARIEVSTDPLPRTASGKVKKFLLRERHAPSAAAAGG
jgi:fatty-acyl-CoA synthase